MKEKKTYFKPNKPIVPFSAMILGIVLMLLWGFNIFSGIFFGFVALDIYYIMKYWEVLEDER